MKWTWRDTAGAVVFITAVVFLLCVVGGSGSGGSPGSRSSSGPTVLAAQPHHALHVRVAVRAPRVTATPKDVTVKAKSVTRIRSRVTLADPTVGLSRAQRRHVTEAMFLASPMAAHVRWCESRDHYTDNTGNGYYGAWQANPGFWDTYGGDPAYLDVAAHRPFLAPRAMQDAVAYAGWLARSWEPWECSRL